MCEEGFTEDGLTGLCTACPGGQYKPTLGNSECLTCPSNSKTDVQGMIYRTQCECQENRVLLDATDECVCIQGFQEVAGQCQACADGWWKADDSNMPCTACAIRASTSGQTGSVSVEQCVCPPNQELSGDGSTCVCSSGFEWNTAIGACLPCSDGTFKSQVRCLHIDSPHAFS